MGLACECVYSHIKQTPGMRPGAVDSLSRRIGSSFSLLCINTVSFLTC